mmetsp:Transcript_20209/g.44818  ORF Transcript_20209/g.44818 Transcript_20209/m.44818 type:complete len:128 (+) Transcript_20209:39-422(+)|eukprot:CAMPEP_0204275178 /NCGR_PEP_ID=MMETSP0468-20130131/25607_1 /ASSEMBLY_ACC=CAM_ASM_000383 /TAXON_ID=2969 /ORGANISM="Oxyrrhis marina" /LENGTH=127 /DNA_ID=CAMNT_0051251477 /DNA_START=32 /DNA_END=415 /DNA_ORIENTATION=+
MESLPLTAQFEQKLKELKALQAGVQKHYVNREQIMTQLNENEGVLKEFGLLEGDAQIFKLVGPVLVKQDLDDSKANVEKRITYIKGQLEDVEKLIKEGEETVGKKQEEAAALQNKYNEQQAQAQQAA